MKSRRLIRALQLNCNWHHHVFLFRVMQLKFGHSIFANLTPFYSRLEIFLLPLVPSGRVLAIEVSGNYGKYLVVTGIEPMSSRHSNRPMVSQHEASLSIFKFVFVRSGSAKFH